ncbi:MAG: tetratricopeptide repeat protein [Pirellulales bacterium]
MKPESKRKIKNHASAKSSTKVLPTGRKTNWATVVGAGILGSIVIILLWIWVTPPDLSSTQNSADLQFPDQFHNSENSAISSPSTPDLTNLFQIPNGTKKVSTEELQAELGKISEYLSNKFPDDPKALHTSALILAELRQTEQASKLWERCIQLANNEIGPVLGFSKLLIDQGNDLRAIELMEDLGNRSTNSLPDNYYHQLAEAYSRIGDVENSQRILSTGLGRYPNDSVLWRLDGLDKIQLRKLEQAEESLRKAIELGDSSSNTRSSLLVLLRRLGKTEESTRLVTEIQAAAEAAANSQASTRSDSNEQDSVFQSKYRNALKEISVPLIRNAASVVLAHQESKQAEQWLLLAINEAPSLPATYMDLAATIRAQGRLGDCLQVHQRLLEVQPNNVFNYLNLASLHAQNNKLDRAQLTLVAASERFPKSAIVVAELAKIALKKGQFKLAEQQAEIALENEPNNIDWILLQAVILKQSNQLDRFQKLISRAKQLSPNDPRLTELAQ